MRRSTEKSKNKFTTRSYTYGNPMILSTALRSPSFQLLPMTRFLVAVPFKRTSPDALETYGYCHRPVLEQWRFHGPFMIVSDEVDHTALPNLVIKLPI